MNNIYLLEVENFLSFNDYLKEFFANEESAWKEACCFAIESFTSFVCCDSDLISLTEQKYGTSNAKKEKSYIRAKKHLSHSYSLLPKINELIDGKKWKELILFLSSQYQCSGDQKLPIFKVRKATIEDIVSSPGDPYIDSVNTMCEEWKQSAPIE
jgi:hypothetical protein